jgi:hypothetical protein
MGTIWEHSLGQAPGFVAAVPIAGRAQLEHSAQVGKGFGRGQPHPVLVDIVQGPTVFTLPSPSGGTPRSTPRRRAAV